MSSPAFSAPLTLEPRSSASLRSALLVLHGLAAGGLLWLPWAWGAVGIVLLVVSGTCEWRRVRRPVRLCWQADGFWEQPGAEGPSTLHGSTFVSRALVVLALDDGRRVRRWTLPRDALPAVQWRRLRARLRVAAVGHHAYAAKSR